MRLVKSKLSIAFGKFVSAVFSVQADHTAFQTLFSAQGAKQARLVEKLMSLITNGAYQRSPCFDIERLRQRSQQGIKDFVRMAF